MNKDFLAKMLLVVALGGLLSGCKTDKDEKYEEKPVQELYQKATENIKNSNFKQAAKDFEEVIRQHPYSAYATRAQLMSAYSYYRAQKYEDAIVSADAFVQLHPGNKDVPYAYYLKGLCFYNQISSVERDQKMTEHAFNTFQELVKRFPLSPYAKDAKLKLDLTSEFLAGGFMDIGRFYQMQYLPIAAVNRFKQVITKYETTSHVPEALYRLIETYLQLGIEKEAQAAAVVLGHNFPGSSWYKLGYELLASKDLLPKSKSEFKIRKVWEQPANAAQSNHP